MKKEEQIIASSHKGSRADEREIEHFARIANSWWDEKGVFKALHAMNPPRMDFITQNISSFLTGSDSHNPFEALKILDAGCGGGILSEALCKKGADVTAVDATEDSLAIAKTHAEQSGLNIDYQLTLVDDMDDKYNGYFDCVCSLEVIEHVPDVAGFLQAIEKKLKPGGLMFLSTINRTPKAILLAKYAAEYLLGLAPKGTHDWRRFVKPSEIQSYANRLGLEVKAITGFEFNPLKNIWKLSNNTDINYAICLQKKKA